MINCHFENGKQAYLRHVVVHALVERQGELLLVKRAPHLLEGGKWGLPSGFMMQDETAAQSVLRELKEETGWVGEVVSLFRINTSPHRDRQIIPLEFIIKPVKKVGEPDNESTKVEWIPIEKLLPSEEFAFDHGEAIQLYLQYRKKSFPLPILI